MEKSQPLHLGMLFWQQDLSSHGVVKLIKNYFSVFVGKWVKIINMEKYIVETSRGNGLLQFYSFAFWLT